MRSMKMAFESGWQSGGAETNCGIGSTMAATSRLRRWLPSILNRYSIRSINDAGCGDAQWYSSMNLRNVDYLGVDVVRYDSWNWNSDSSSQQFKCADICKTVLRKCDLTICRDVLIHLPNSMASKALRNMKASSKYLLASSFETACNSERHIELGEFARLNLEIEPFDLGVPVLKIHEKFRGKYLGLWQLNEEEQ